MTYQNSVGSSSTSLKAGWGSKKSMIEVWLSYIPLIVGLIILSAFALAAPRPADAAVFSCATVNCLINSINTANGNGVNDTINLTAGTYNLAAVNNNTDGPNGLPSITSQIRINGDSLNSSGAITTTINRSASSFRIFRVASTGNLTLDRISVTNGTASGGGGVFVDGGRLTLINSNVSGSDDGGGIFNDDGIVSLINTTVSDNLNFFTGGGLINANGGEMNLNRSTVNNNETSHGGGIISEGTLIVTNSTISGNSASVNGGGINSQSGTVNLNHVTITNNTADSDSSGIGDGGGIIRVAGTVNVRNSIIAGNFDDSPNPNDQVPDCSGTLNSQGRNLVGNEEGCTFLDTTGDEVGTAESPINPQLGLLQDNSSGNGTTRTHALLPGSPAIDAGSNDSCLSSDQRNFIRPADGNGNAIATCDKGAFERSANPTCGFTITPAPPPIFIIITPLPATIVGTSGNNNLNGTAGVDRIHGLGGNDTINGLGDNDTLCGGPGADTLDGGPGTDTLNGDDGADTLRGGSGNDSLLGGSGNDNLNGQDGNDSLNGGANTDTCNGADGGGDTASECETIMNIP